MLFDGYWWGGGPIANRTVQREFISAWAALFPDDEIVVAIRPGVATEDLPANARAVPVRMWPHGLSNRLELGRLARAHAVDAVIAHNYTPKHPRSVVFIHDVMFLDRPEWFSFTERAYFAGMLPLAAGAAVVATSTRTELDRIRRRLSGERPWVVTGLGVSAELTSGKATEPPQVAGIESFALTVGRLNIRKNLESVIAAAGMSRSISADSPLLIVGGSDHSGVSPELSELVEDLVSSGRVRFLGRVDDAELAWLYAHARLVISLSLDEGFGMTPVEAVSFGAPLLVSDIPVHRETVGGYAVFVDPHAGAIETAHAIDSAWGQRGDEAQRAEILSRYTWAAAAGNLRSAVEATLP